MLYRLVRTYLTPYAAMLGVLLVLQLIATLASLYLPSLNGRIIDEGVAVGDTSCALLPALLLGRRESGRCCGRLRRTVLLRTGRSLLLRLVGLGAAGLLTRHAGHPIYDCSYAIC